METKKSAMSKTPSGAHNLGLITDLYDEVITTEEESKCLSRNFGSYFTDKVTLLLKEASSGKDFMNQEVYSNYTYSVDYKGPRDLLYQINTIAFLFGLNKKEAIEFANHVPIFSSDQVEGRFVIPKESSVAKKFFPQIKDEETKHCEVTKLVLDIMLSLGGAPVFDQMITPGRFRRTEESCDFFRKIEEDQPGDILIIDAQYGKKHRGRSMWRSETFFSPGEFHLGLFEACCMNILHPTRFGRWRDLGIICGGDEFSENKNGIFLKAPALTMSEKLRLAMINKGCFYNSDGPITGFYPLVK